MVAKSNVEAMLKGNQNSSQVSAIFMIPCLQQFCNICDTENASSTAIGALLYQENSTDKWTIARSSRKLTKHTIPPPNEKYVLGKENAFTDFLSRKYEVNKINDDEPSTSKSSTHGDSISIIKTKAISKQKTATQPQIDLEAPKTPEEEKIVDPFDLPNQDPWPFLQQ
uniref:Uncharacterized protein n=1 Tax=Romanomermis culicivorax TaxID=13658 RepID=A0A915HTM1_ROMCU